MNSIHEAIRKFRPDLKLDGWSASARLIPAVADYPEYIKPETVVRGLVRNEPFEAGPPQAAPAITLSRRQMASLGLVFALAVVFGAGVALKPAKVGDVSARPAPEHLVSPMQNTEAFTKVVTAAPQAKVAAVAAPAVAPVASAPKKSEAAATVKLETVPKRGLAPLKKATEYVSLQPVKSAAPVAATTNIAPVAAPVTVVASAMPTSSVTVAAVEPQAAAPTAKGGVPEILYEAESPQSVPASTGAEIAALPAANVTAPRAAGKPDAPTPSSSSGRIQGIFWDKERPMALLGDDIVEVGSETPLGRVVQIDKKFVVFEKAGGKRVTMTP